MIFDESKAIEIIRKHNLSDTTLRVWKTRGSIPDKYSKEDYVKRETISSRADKIISKRVCNILLMSEINTAVISEIINCPELNDIVRGKNSFSGPELLSAIKEIKRLKIDVLKTFESYSPHKMNILLHDERIKPFAVCRDFTKRELQNLREKGLDNKIDFEKLKDCFVKFAIQLSVD